MAVGTVRGYCALLWQGNQQLQLLPPALRMHLLHLTGHTHAVLLWKGSATCLPGMHACMTGLCPSQRLAPTRKQDSTTIPSMKVPGNIPPACRTG